MKPTDSRPTRPSGMTLIELLTVIAIIGILAGLLFPAMKGSRTNARKVQCMSNARQIANAIFLYAADNDGWLPYGYDTYNVPARCVNAIRDPAMNWQARIYGASNQYGVVKGYLPYDDQSKRGKLWHCPFLQIEGPKPLSEAVMMNKIHYGISGGLRWQMKCDVPNNCTWYLPPTAWRLSNIPKNYILITDAHMDVYQGAWYAYDWADYGGNQYTQFLPWPVDGFATQAGHITPGKVHGGVCSAMMVDGHGEFISWPTITNRQYWVRIGD